MSRIPDSDPQSPTAHDQLSEWCAKNLGAPIGERLFEHAHSSVVTGARLADGMLVVIKMRPPSDRFLGCFEVQKHLHARGFPCPEPLLPPTRLGKMNVSVERMVTGGTMFSPRAEAPAHFAAALADLISLAPAVSTVRSLAPAPPWIGWDHPEEPTWPPPDDLDADLNIIPGPSWLDAMADRVRARLEANTMPEVIGHGDFESHTMGPAPAPRGARLGQRGQPSRGCTRGPRRRGVQRGGAA